jgi:DNA primase
MDVRRLLEKYDVKITAERTDNYDCLCPIHEKDGSSPSFSIHKDSGLWICRSKCGSGNIINLISRIEKCSFSEAKEKLGVYFDRKSLLSERFNKLRELFSFSRVKPDLPIMEYPEGFTLISERTEIDAPDYYNYITSRLDIKIIKEFGLGYTTIGKNSGRIILPVYINKKLIGYTARSIHSDATKRYLIPEGCRTSKMIWGYDQESSSESWVCESIFDALTLILWGIRPVYATFGARISNEQIDHLLSKKVKDLIICFHNDPAGIEGVESKRKILSSLFNVRSAILPENSDINEMSREKFFSSINFVELKENGNTNRIKDILQRKRKNEEIKKFSY